MNATLKGRLYGSKPFSTVVFPFGISVLLAKTNSRADGDGVPIGDEVSVGEGELCMDGELEGEGVEVLFEIVGDGDALGKIATPSFHTNFPFTFTQVNFLFR